MSFLHRFAAMGRSLGGIAHPELHTPHATSLAAVSTERLAASLPGSLQQWTSWSWQRVVSLIPSLEDIRLLAVPKRKVTPHRKGNRSATKNIRFIPIVSRCSKCESVFPPHAMPAKCEYDDCPAFNLRERPGSRLVPETEP